MNKVLRVWVPGIPIAQGSMRSPKAGVVLHGSDLLAAWRDQIGYAAKEKWRGFPLIDGPVNLECRFYFDKPKSPRHDLWRDTAPDLDKLVRAVDDALEGVVLKNDARIVTLLATKAWIGEPPYRSAEPGAFIRLEELS